MHVLLESVVMIEGVWKIPFCNVVTFLCGWRHPKVANNVILYIWASTADHYIGNVQSVLPWCLYAFLLRKLYNSFTEAINYPFEFYKRTWWSSVGIHSGKKISDSIIADKLTASTTVKVCPFDLKVWNGNSLMNKAVMYSCSSTMRYLILTLIFGCVIFQDVSGVARIRKSANESLREPARNLHYTLWGQHNWCTATAIY